MALECSDFYDISTGAYNSECAALYLNMINSDYNFVMAILGGLTGLVFVASIVYLILNIGKTWRVK